MSAASTSSIDTVRRMLWGLLLFGMIGTSSELWLMGHDEDWRQLIPFAGMALSALATAWLAWRRSLASARLFRACMLVLMLTGAVGSVLHYRANMEFQLEMDPTMGGLTLMAKVLHAKAPPALAPGNMMLLGLLGMISTIGLIRPSQS